MHGSRTQFLQNIPRGDGIGDQRAVLDVGQLLGDQPFLSSPQAADTLAGDTFDSALLADVFRVKRVEIGFGSDFNVIEFSLAGGRAHRSRLATERLFSAVWGRFPCLFN